MVADLWQGEGLGTALFHRLAARARELGVERFIAEVLPHNRRMLNVFHHSGLPCHRPLCRDGVVHVVLDLGDDRSQVAERSSLPGEVVAEPRVGDGDQGARPAGRSSAPASRRRRAR